MPVVQPLGPRLRGDEQTIDMPTRSHGADTRSCDADYTLTPYSLVFRIRLLAVLAGQDFLGNQPGVLAHRGLDFGGHVGIGLEEGFGVFAPLADTL